MDCKDQRADERKKALQYFAHNGIPKILEDLLNNMYYDNPSDVFAYLGNNLLKLAKPPTFSKIEIERAISAQNGTALEASLYCVVNAKENFTCDLVVSLNQLNHHDTRNERIVNLIKRWMNESVNAMMQGCNMTDDTLLEALLSKAIENLLFLYTDLNWAVEHNKNSEKHTTRKLSKKDDRPLKSKSKQSLESISETTSPTKDALWMKIRVLASWCVSSLLCKGQAVLLSRTMHAHVNYLCQGCKSQIPELLITVFHNSKFNWNKLIGVIEAGVIIPENFPFQRTVDLVQHLYEMTAKYVHLKTGNVVSSMSDVGAFSMINFDHLDHPLEYLTEITNSSESLSKMELTYFMQFIPKETFDYDKNKYEYIKGSFKSGDEIVELILEVVKKYPLLSILIDPFHVEDRYAWSRFYTRREELSMSSLCREFCSFSDSYDKGFQFLESHTFPICGIILRPEVGGSLVELFDFHKFLKDKINKPLRLMFNLSDYDVIETSLIDLAIGMCVDQIKLGGFTRGERISNVNRLLEIDTELEKFRSEEPSADQISATSDETINSKHISL